MKLVYDRVEDMLATTKRHPAVIRHRTGVTRDGRLTAIDIDAVFDGGAYATLSAVVLSRGVIHASGPYRCDHVRIRGRAAMTNTPPNGAFRGFGAPQTQFAVEVHMDRIAAALGLDPVRAARDQRAAPGRHDGDRSAARTRLQRAAGAARSGEAHRLQAAPQGARRARNRGIGLSLFFHGSGFTGGGEVKLASKASLALTERGARILVAQHRDRAGHADDARADRRGHARACRTTAIEVNAADTGVVPDSGPTVASRTCMVVGRHPAALRRGDARAARRADAARVPARGTVRSS